MIFDAVLKFLGELFFEKFCVGCSREGSFICKDCLKTIKFLEKQKCPHCRKDNFLGSFCGTGCSSNYYFDQLIVCLKYSKNSLVQKLIIQWKYKFSKEITVILGEILRTLYVYFAQFVPDFSNALIVPVPIHKKRLKSRGFNQAELLARYFYKNFQNLVFCDCLKRSIFSGKQSLLARKNRLTNIKGTIILDPKYTGIIKGKFILLIDDIATTGATLNECSKVLKSYGAKYVCGLVLARG